MLTLETRLHVEDLTAQEIWDVLAHPSDRAYREWWPGTHLAFHPLTAGADRVGDVVDMDEYVGARRLRMRGVVREAVPGRRLAWQLRRGIPLPARLTLDLEDDARGVRIVHTVEAGLRGPGRVLDPLVGLHFSRSFAAALEEHVRTEFPLLRDRLHRGRARR